MTVNQGESVPFKSAAGNDFPRWQALEDLILEILPREHARAYLELLRNIADDQECNGRIVLGMNRAPGSVGHHHAYEGGLIAHLLEMWTCWAVLRPLIQPAMQINRLDHLSDERILRGILNHDIHKGYYRYRLISTEPWKVEYNPEDEPRALMQKDCQSIWLLNKYGVPLDPLQMNAIVLAEGGFSHIKPEWTSVLAKTIYLLDELSANVISRLHDGLLTRSTKTMRI